MKDIEGHGFTGNYFESPEDLAKTINLGYSDEEAGVKREILQNAGIPHSVGEFLLVPKLDNPESSERGVISNAKFYGETPIITLTLLDEEGIAYDRVIRYESELMNDIKRLMGW